MADQNDPIVISDDEEQQQQRRPRRACRRDVPMSVWYGQRRRRGGVARGGLTTRERGMLGYIVAIAALAYPTFGHGVNRLTGEHYTIHNDNARYLREGRFGFIRIPTIESVAQAMANQMVDQRVQMT